MISGYQHIYKALHYIAKISFSFKKAYSKIRASGSKICEASQLAKPICVFAYAQRRKSFGFASLDASIKSFRSRLSFLLICQLLQVAA